jgi:hypothetical protein
MKKKTRPAAASVTRDPFGGLFETLKPGTRIGFVCGPSGSPEEDAGTVYERKESRWGRFLRVKKDDFTFTTVHGLSDVGIGAYLLKVAA